MANETILLNSVEKVKAFVSGISDCRCSAKIRSGTYEIDARSILGILSLDIAKPVSLILNGDQKDIDRALEIAGAYAA